MSSNAVSEKLDERLDVFASGDEGRLEPAPLEEALASLLESHPEAPIAALRADGVMVAMPDSLALRGNPVLKARSGADVVVMDEQVIRGWERVLSRGAAKYAVRRPARPESVGTVYGLDLRERHGVIVTLEVYEADEASGRRPTPPELPDLTPRFATLWKDQRGLVTKVDDALTKLLGWSAAEIVGRRSLEFIHPDDHALAIDNWMEMLAYQGPGRRVRLRHRRSDESWIWLELTNHNLFADPAYACVVSEMVDISEEMAAHELLDRLAAAVPVGLLQADADGRIVYANDRLGEILGVGRTDTLEQQLTGVELAGRAQLETALKRALADRTHADVEIRVQRPGGGGPRCCSVSLRPLSQDDGSARGVIACVTDVTDSARMREELERRATLDELTGCYNRASIMRILEQDLASGRRSTERAVIFVDLDGFKAINDEHGHAVGDEVLRVVSRRLRELVREQDAVGRMGGDEFLLVCPQIDGPERTRGLVERLAEAQCEPVVVGGCTVVVQASIGVAWSSDDGRDADALVAQADAAMYASKRQGEGQPQLVLVR